jgi:hypothetical protein
LSCLFFLLSAFRQLELEREVKMRQYGGDGHRDREESTVIFVGHARLPQSLAPAGAPPVVSVEIEVDVRRRQAVEVATRGVLPRAEALLRDILLEGDLDASVRILMDALQRRYVGAPQKAIMTAVSNAYDAYVRFCQQQAVSEGSLRPSS